MLPTIQKISPSYVIRSLIPKPYGTYIVRYPTENDEVISLISFPGHSNQDPLTSLYVILSIRVDETVYKEHTKHYRLPYNEQNIQEDVKKILETYNRQQYKLKNGTFTPLKEELIPPTDDGNWVLEGNYFKDVDFTRIANPGKNNDGICTAMWECVRQNSVKVFIKRFKTGSSYFTHEFSLLKDLCHPTIVTFYGHYSDNDYNYLVFENSGQSLESLCPLKIDQSREKTRFIANVGFQVAYAMMYLEQKNIVHRDLTAGNVLLNSYGFIRVVDFGHAIKKEEGINTLERARTVHEENRFQFRFLAPECLPGTKEEAASNGLTAKNSNNFCARFTSKSDIWSYGILIMQLMLEDPRKPYPDLFDKDITKYVKEDKKIHPKLPECPTDMYLILEGCWQYEANKRISFADARAGMFRLEGIFR